MTFRKAVWKWKISGKSLLPTCSRGVCQSLVTYREQGKNTAHRKTALLISPRSPPLLLLCSKPQPSQAQRRSQNIFDHDPGSGSDGWSGQHLGGQLHAGRRGAG